VLLCLFGFLFCSLVASVAHFALPCARLVSMGLSYGWICFIIVVADEWGGVSGWRARLSEVGVAVKFADHMVVSVIV